MSTLAFRVMRAWAIAALVVLVASAGAARASDFWDEVRRPGSRAFREDVRAGRAALERVPPEPAQALALLDRALARFPDEAPAHALRALALHRLGRGAEAVEAAHRALALAPQSFETPRDAEEVAALSLGAGDPALASMVLSRAARRLRTSPERARLEGLEGEALLRQGPPMLPEALRVLEHAAQGAPPGGDRAHDLLALALRLAGERARSHDILGARPRAEHDGRGVLDTGGASATPTDPLEAALRAVRREAGGDEAGARALWQLALAGPWREVIERTVLATPDRPRGRR